MTDGRVEGYLPLIPLSDPDQIIGDLACGDLAW